MAKSELSTIELKAFVPAKDFALSQRFYLDLGFAKEPLGEDLVCFTLGPSKFLLQNFYRKAFAECLAMHLLVHDVEGWWAKASKIVPAYGTSLDIVRTQPWGIRDFTMHDPSGVLWRIGQEVASA